MELTIDQAIEKAIEAHKSGQLHEADKLYTAILKVESKHPDINHNMGVLAVAFGKVEEALPFFKTALEVNSNKAQFWLSYINTLIKLDRLLESKTLLNQAKAKGITGEGFDKLEQSLNIIQQRKVNITKPREPSENQIQSLINLYGSGQLQQALTKSHQMLKNFPNSANIYNIAGVCNLGLLQIDAAIESFTLAIEIKPNFFDPHYNMGLALKKNGNLDTAIESYKEAIKIKSNSYETYFNMGLALTEKGDLEAAISSYKLSLNLRPSSADSYLNLGNVQFTKGEIKAAIFSYEQAVKFKPNNAVAHYNMGRALKGIGNLDAAKESFKQAIKIRPNYPDAKHLLASLEGKTTASPPRVYVERLFDQYAARFDNSLVNKLCYNVPKIIRELIIKKNKGSSLGSILDLGCGTGLIGVELKQFCQNIEGIDLSKLMLRQAEKKTVYGKLTHIDITDYLSTAELSFDYFISADVFIYMGELSDVFDLIRNRNRTQGKLIFSTEHTEKRGFSLEKSGRYSHSKKYIEYLCEKFNYRLSYFKKIELRKEQNKIISGALYMLDF